MFMKLIIFGTAKILFLSIVVHYFFRKSFERRKCAQNNGL